MAGKFPKAKVFDRAYRKHRRVLTRFKGGFDTIELVIGIGFIVACAVLIEYWPLEWYIPYLWIGYQLILAKRRLKTDFREFEDWLRDMIKYHVRPHPLRSIRLVSGKIYYLPAPHAITSRIAVFKKKGEARDDRTQR